MAHEVVQNGEMILVLKLLVAIAFGFVLLAL
jgi:hypothetical protein